MQKLTPLIIYLQNDGQFSYFILKTSLHEKVSHAKFLAKIYNFDFCSTIDVPDHHLNCLTALLNYPVLKGKKFWLPR